MPRDARASRRHRLQARTHIHMRRDIKGIHMTHRHDVLAAALTALAAVAALLAATPAAFAHDDQGHAMPAAGQGHAAALGRPGDAAEVTRTVKITMNDTMRFEPRRIAVKRGDTVRFVLVNKGRLAHEMVLGTRAELQDHAEQMRKHPGMEHDDPNQANVAAGKTGELVWQFTQAGRFDFACLLPGHFEAGMRGQIDVVAAASGHGH